MLTPIRLFCLTALSKTDATGRDISKAAIEAGLNQKAHGRLEWADGHLKWLRDKGFAEHTGARDQSSKLHRITHAGRNALPPK